jgi:hypothetical protein
MNPRSLKGINILTLSISIVVTILVMLRASAWSVEVDLGTLLFIGWAISPYIIFFVLGIALERFTSVPQVPLIACVVSLLMLAFTVLAYIGTLGDGSSTNALIFLFIPLYLYIGSFAILIGTLIVVRMFERFKNRNI